LDDVLEMDFSPEERVIFELRKGDVLIAEASGSADQVGKPAIWQGELPTCCFQNTVIRFRPYSISSQYAYYVIRHYAENGVFLNLLRGVGIAHLGGDRFANIPFPLPPKPEQERIAAKLDMRLARLHRALQSLRRAQANVQLSRASVLNSAMTGELPELPGDPPRTKEGWPSVPLGELVTVTNGRAFKTSEWSDSGLPIIRIQNLKDSAAPYNYFASDIEERFTVNPQDLLFAWSGTPGTSFGAFIWDGPKGVLNQHIFKLTFDAKVIDKEFLLFALNHKVADFIATAKGGGGLAHVTRPEFLKGRIPIPPLRTQQTIVAAIRSRFTTLDKQETVVNKSIERCDTLRRASLSRAVCGQLVRQDSKDEPVQELMLRIAQERSRQEEQLTQLLREKKKESAAEGRGKYVPSVRRLADVLTEFGPMTAEELYRKAGYSADRSEDMLRFYDALASARREKEVVSEDVANPDQAKWRAAKA
jgi:type I restriction enzyme S subunit